MIIAVSNMDIIKIPNELNRAFAYLINKFEMKDLGKTKLYIGLQINHLSQGVLIYQSAYEGKGT